MGKVKKCKTAKLIVTLMLICLSLFFIFNVSTDEAEAATIKYSGTSGSCSWSIDSDGLLRIWPKNGTSGMLANSVYETWVSEGASYVSFPWSNYATSIYEVRVEQGVKTNACASAMFEGLKNCKKMDLSGIDTSSTKHMANMFYNCNSVEELDLSSFDTSNVLGMSAMFGNCYKLKNVNLSSFNTSNVSEIRLGANLVLTSSSGMGHMFMGCYALESLDLSHFDTSKVMGMEGMFSRCYNLTSLDLSNFTTTNFDDGMSYMFQDCWSLVSLDIRNFDTSSFNAKYDMKYTFDGCDELTELVLGNKFKFMTNHSLPGTWVKTHNLDNSRTYNTTAYSPDVIGTSTISSAGIWRLNGICWWEVTSEGTLWIHPVGTTATIDEGTVYCEELDSWVMPWAAEYRNVIKKIYVDPGVYTDVYADALFAYLPNCKEADLGNLNTSNAISFNSMFWNSNSIEVYNIANWDTSNVTDMSYMFGNYNCTNSNLKQLDLSGWNTSNVTSMSTMFQGCTGLTSLDLSNFNTKKVTDMSYMFFNCSNLKSLDMRNFDTSAVTSNMTNTFYNNVSLQKIIFGTNFKFYNVTNLPNVNNWVKVRNLNNTKTYNTTEYTFSQLSTFNSTTNPSIGGIWTRYGMDDTFITNPDGTVEYISVDDEWVMVSDEVWTYTFKVFDDTLVYHLYEKLINGYMSEAMEPYYITIKNNQGTITNVAEGKIGKLSITKQVIGNIPASEDGRSFKFTLTLSGKDISGVQKFGDILFENGVGIFYLQHGFTKVFELPVGTTFTIEESAIDSYNSSISQSTGVISADSIVNVQAVNTYVETPSSGENTVNITIRKTMESGTSSDRFNFGAYFTGLASSKEYKLSNGESFVSSETGIGYYALKLGSDESVVFYNIPVGATYQFTEEAGAYVSSYFVTNQTSEGTIEKVTDKNDEIYKDLSTAVETADAGEDILIEFKNKIKTVQNLSVSKIVKEEQEDGSYIEIESDNTYFEFTINFSNIPAGTSFSSAIGKIVPDKDGFATKTFYLQNGQTVEFYDIPAGVQFQIEESSNQYRPSYFITGLNIVKNYLESNHSRQSLSTEKETLDENENATVIFSNLKALPKDKYIYLKKGINTFGKDYILEDIANNRMYSLEGAEYEIVIDGEVVETLITDEHGEATSDLLFTDGTYGIIREIKAPQGFMLDNREYRFSIDTSDGNEYYEISVLDAPTFDPTVFSFKKVDEETVAPQGNTSFKGAIFKYEYFDNLNWDGVPTRTWYFETDSDGLHAYHPDYLADGYSSSDLYVGLSGAYEIPLGSVRITETESPLGYKEIPVLKATIIQETSGAGAKWSWTADSLEFLKSSSSNIYELEEPIDTELFRAISITKLDAVTNSADASEGGNFIGVEFTVYNISENAVKVGDFDVAQPGEPCYVLTISEGNAVSTDAIFPLGSYKVMETKGNDDYYCNTEWAYEFEVTVDTPNEVISMECANEPIVPVANITLRKVVTNPEVLMDDQTFTFNVEFQNLRAGKVYSLSNGDTITALEDGTATYVAVLANGDKIVFHDIPVRTLYKITEVAGQYTASYSIIDNNKR